MEATSPLITYAPLIIAVISALGFVVTVGILIFSRVFRLGKFFAEFTALQETVADLQVTVADLQVTVADNKTELQQAIADNKTELQQAIADNKTELQQAIADNRAEIAELRQEMRDGFNRIDAGLQELRGYFVSHLEHHADFPADDD